MSSRFHKGWTCLRIDEQVLLFRQRQMIVVRTHDDIMDSSCRQPQRIVRAFSTHAPREEERCQEIAGSFRRTFEARRFSEAIVARMAWVAIEYAESGGCRDSGDESGPSETLNRGPRCGDACARMARD